MKKYWDSFLNKKIAVTCPSDRISNEADLIRLRKAINNFNEKGIEVILGRSVKENLSPNEKAEEFQRYYLDPEISAIFSGNGGETQKDIIPYLNFEKLKKAKKKIFQGFSDNTVITFLLAIKADTPSVYNACFPSFGMDTLDKTLEENLEILLGKRNIQESTKEIETHSRKKDINFATKGYNYDAKNTTQNLHEDKNFSAEGTLLGGCLDVLSFFINDVEEDIIKYIEKNKSVIWYLENCCMDLEKLKNLLIYMKNKNFFTSSPCILLGRGKKDLDDSFRKEEEKVFLEVLGSLQIPLVTGANFGHTRPFITYINGAKVTVNYDNNKLKLIYK